jgi:hypothetical protein
MAGGHERQGPRERASRVRRVPARIPGRRSIATARFGVP